MVRKLQAEVAQARTRSFDPYYASSIYEEKKGILLAPTLAPMLYVPAEDSQMMI